MKKSKLLSCLEIILWIIFIVSFSVSLPILIRPFYYVQIKTLNLVEKTGYTFYQIKEAYNCMLDYCLGLTDVFSCGILRYSESGMSHFTDCRSLFILDLVCLISSGIGLILIKLELKNYLFCFKHKNGLYSCFVLLILFVSIAIGAIIDFDKMFELFHMFFFPGKTNWIFDSYYDEIINILPEQFFINCGILIVASIIIISLYFIVSDIKERKKHE